MRRRPLRGGPPRSLSSLFPSRNSLVRGHTTFELPFPPANSRLHLYPSALPRKQFLVAFCKATPGNLPLHCLFLSIKQSRGPGRPLNHGLSSPSPSPWLPKPYPLPAASAPAPPPPWPRLSLEHCLTLTTLSSGPGLPPPVGPRPAK